MRTSPKVFLYVSQIPSAFSRSKCTLSLTHTMNEAYKPTPILPCGTNSHLCLLLWVGIYWWSFRMKCELYMGEESQNPQKCTPSAATLRFGTRTCALVWKQQCYQIRKKKTNLYDETGICVDSALHCICFIVAAFRFYHLLCLRSMSVSCRFCDAQHFGLHKQTPFCLRNVIFVLCG